MAVVPVVSRRFGETGDGKDYAGNIIGPSTSPDGHTASGRRAAVSGCLRC